MSYRRPARGSLMRGRGVARRSAGLGALTAKPTVQAVAMGVVGGLVGRVGGWSISWQDALPEGSGLPPVWMAWTGGVPLDADLFAQLIRDGYTVRESSCEGGVPLGATREGSPTVEFNLTAREAFLVGQRCPGDFLPRQRQAFQGGGMPLATPQGVIDAMWDMLLNPGRWPGFVPATSIVRTDAPPASDPVGSLCDVVQHQDAVQAWRRGSLSDSGLLAVYNGCRSAGGTPPASVWNGSNIPGFLPGPPARIVRTGDGTVTLPDGTAVDAPSGGTTELPPSDPGDGWDECPPGWEPGDAPGICIRYDCSPGYVNVNGECVPADEVPGPGYPGPGSGPGTGPGTPGRAGVGWLVGLGILGAFLAGERDR